MKLWYTKNSPFTSYTTVTTHSDSRSNFSFYVTSHVQYTAFSGKFSRGRNFRELIGNSRDFCDQTSAREICCRENSSIKFLLTMSRACTVSSSRRSSKLTKIDLFVVEASSKLRKLLRPMVNSLVVTTTANRSSELAPFLWHGSF